MAGTKCTVITLSAMTWERWTDDYIQTTLTTKARPTPLDEMKKKRTPQIVVQHNAN
jgi:hypothetical protein